MPDFQTYAEGRKKSIQPCSKDKVIAKQIKIMFCIKHTQNNINFMLNVVYYHDLCTWQNMSYVKISSVYVVRIKKKYVMK